MAVIVGQGISVSPVADAELSHESTSTVQNKVVTDAIASEYSTSKTYSVGDVCTHDGKLYECIVDIPTAEGWTLAHWKVSNIGDVASNLNRQLSDKPDINIGITGASVGQIIRVLTVDANGKPQTWEVVDEDRVVTVSGTTATIVAEAGVRYVCGELAELTFTPPASGLTAIRFTSGTTPTVISLLPTNDVKMPDDWTGTLDASQVYEINFEDRLGLVAQWS